MVDQNLRAATISIDDIEATLPPKDDRSHKVVIKLDHVDKIFGEGQNKNHVLKDINLNIYAGEFAIIYGPSGSGKSTILHSILGLEKPTKGRVLLRGQDLYQMKADELASYRRQKIGMVFQQSNWIKALKVWENIAYPLWLAGKTEEESKMQALSLLEEVGSINWAYQKATELSGGQQQRVSLARALAADQNIIIADEPTGNLDTKNSAEILKLFCRLNRVHNKVIVMVTHETNYLPLCNRRIMIVDGEIAHDERDSADEKEVAQARKTRVSVKGLDEL